MKIVYSSIQATVANGDTLREREFSAYYGIIATKEDVFSNKEVMSMFVVSALRCVPLLGVAQSLSRRREDKRATTPASSGSDSGSCRVPWCVSTSRTAISCCRLFDCFKAAHEAYTIVTEHEGGDTTFSCQEHSRLGFSTNTSEEEATPPWDLKMVLKHGIFLPRVCFEYSGIELRQPSPDQLSEKAANGGREACVAMSYLDKARIGSLQNFLSQSNVYEKLRDIRVMLYRSMHHCANSGDRCLAVVEVLRKGKYIEVAPIQNLTLEVFPDHGCGRDSVIDAALQGTLVALTQTRCGTLPNCSVCKRLFNTRCLQLSLFIKLLGVALSNNDECSESNGEEGFDSYIIYSFQLSAALLVARHIWREFVSLSCDCFDGSTVLLDNTALGGHHCGAILTDFQFTNLWTTVEVCVIHSDYLTFCAQMKSSVTTSPSIGEDTFWMARGMSFPLDCLSPATFRNIHHDVLMKCKSRDGDGVSAFVRAFALSSVVKCSCKSVCCCAESSKVGVNFCALVNSVMFDC